MVFILKLAKMGSHGDQNFNHNDNNNVGKRVCQAMLTNYNLTAFACNMQYSSFIKNITTFVIFLLFILITKCHIQSEYQKKNDNCIFVS